MHLFAERINNDTDGSHYWNIVALLSILAKEMLFSVTTKIIECQHREKSVEINT